MEDCEMRDSAITETREELGYVSEDSRPVIRVKERDITHPNYDILKKLFIDLETYSNLIEKRRPFSDTDETPPEVRAWAKVIKEKAYRLYEALDATPKHVLCALHSDGFPREYFDLPDTYPRPFLQTGEFTGFRSRLRFILPEVLINGGGNKRQMVRSLRQIAEDWDVEIPSGTMNNVGTIATFAQKNLPRLVQNKYPFIDVGENIRS